MTLQVWIALAFWCVGVVCLATVVADWLAAPAQRPCCPVHDEAMPETCGGCCSRCPNKTEAA